MKNSCILLVVIYNYISDAPTHEHQNDLELLSQKLHKHEENHGRRDELGGLKIKTHHVS
jgi:hypothetical protein